MKNSVWIIVIIIGGGGGLVTLFALLSIVGFGIQFLALTSPFILWLLAAAVYTYRAMPTETENEKLQSNLANAFLVLVGLTALPAAYFGCAYTSGGLYAVGLTALFGLLILPPCGIATALMAILLHHRKKHRAAVLNWVSTAVYWGLWILIALQGSTPVN